MQSGYIREDSGQENLKSPHMPQLRFRIVTRMPMSDYFVFGHSGRFHIPKRLDEYKVTSKIIFKDITVYCSIV